MIVTKLPHCPTCNILLASAGYVMNAYGDNVPHLIRKCMFCSYQELFELSESETETLQRMIREHEAAGTIRTTTY